MRKLAGVSIFSLIALSACAFDVIHLRQSPAHYEAVAPSDERWVLQHDAPVAIVSGWATPLQMGTTWQRVGRISEGDVLYTRDQVVTVEASNMFEAEPVIKQGEVVGFYLPIEKSFTPADPPLAVDLALQK